MVMMMAAGRRYPSDFRRLHFLADAACAKKMQLFDCQSVRNAIKHGAINAKNNSVGVSLIDVGGRWFRRDIVFLPGAETPH